MPVPASNPADPGVCDRCGHELQFRPDAHAAARASGEWGVLSLAELHECGLSRREVRIRVKNGWLHPLYRGVYAVGHPGIALEGRFLAAVKSLGAGAVLSHFAAAALWGFVDWDGRFPEVTVPRQGIGAARKDSGSLLLGARAAGRHAPREDSGHLAGPDARRLCCVANEKLLRPQFGERSGCAVSACGSSSRRDGASGRVGAPSGSIGCSGRRRRRAACSKTSCSTSSWMPGSPVPT